MIMTTEAIERAKAIRSKNHSEDWGLRVGITSGGCSGLSYKMDFVETPEEKDRVLEFEGLKVFVDPKAFLYLQNVEVGFHTDMMSSTFTFSNPDAKSTCGCGTSFSV